MRQFVRTLFSVVVAVSTLALLPAAPAAAASASIGSFAGSITAPDGSAGSSTTCATAAGPCQVTFNLTSGICSIGVGQNAGTASIQINNNPDIGYSNVPLIGAGSAGSGVLVGFMFAPVAKVTINARAFCQSIAVLKAVGDAARSYGTFTGDLQAA